MFKEIKEHKEWINNILSHLECSVVSDFLVKFSNGTKDVSTQEWLVSIGVVEKLYKFFSKGTSPLYCYYSLSEHAALHVNAYNVVSEILLDSATTWTQPLVQNFASEKNLAILTKELFAADNSSGFIHGTKILSKVRTLLVLGLFSVLTSSCCSC